MRDSDRLVTPAVVICLVVAGTLCVLATIGAVTWMTARGLDPDPMLKLVGVAVTACGSLGSFILAITSRATLAKTERNTGHLATAVWDVADALPRPVTPPVPPPAARHAADDTLIRAQPRKPPLPGAQGDA